MSLANLYDSNNGSCVYTANMDSKVLTGTPLPATPRLMYQSSTGEGYVYGEDGRLYNTESHVRLTLPEPIVSMCECTVGITLLLGASGVVYYTTTESFVEGGSECGKIVTTHLTLRAICYVLFGNMAVGVTRDNRLLYISYNPDTLALRTSPIACPTDLSAFHSISATQLNVDLHFCVWNDSELVVVTDQDEARVDFCYELECCVMTTINVPFVLLSNGDVYEPRGELRAEEVTGLSCCYDANSCMIIAITADRSVFNISTGCVDMRVKGDIGNC